MYLSSISSRLVYRLTILVPSRLGSTWLLCPVKTRLSLAFSLGLVSFSSHIPAKIGDSRRSLGIRSLSLNNVWLWLGGSFCLLSLLALNAFGISFYRDAFHLRTPLARSRWTLSTHQQLVWETRRSARRLLQKNDTFCRALVVWLHLVPPFATNHNSASS